MSEKTLRQETSTVRYHPGSLLKVSTNRETVLSPESFSPLKVISSSHIYPLLVGSGVGKGLFVYINRWNNLEALLLLSIRLGLPVYRLRIRLPTIYTRSHVRMCIDYDFVVDNPRKPNRLRNVGHSHSTSTNSSCRTCNILYT